jgi:hypothetical protein
MLVYVLEDDTIYQLKVPNTTWQTLSDSQKVAQLANNANWVPLETGGGGDAIRRDYNAPAHSFVVGEVAAFDSNGNLVKGIASPNVNDEIVGIVSDIIDTNNVEVTYAGFLDTTNITGLTLMDNTVYFVSTTVAGQLQDFEPFNAGEESKPILLVQDNNEAIVLSYRGLIVNEALVGGQGEGTRIQRRFTQTAHGFVTGDAIQYDRATSGFIKSRAVVGLQSDQNAGVVGEVLSPDEFIIVFNGYIENITGVLDDQGVALSGDTLYYLSADVDGKLTATEPSLIGQISKPILSTFTTGDGVVLNHRGLSVALLSSGGTGIAPGTPLFIGPAEDGTYDDGFFKDFTATGTTVGTAVDRFNELFAILAPAPAPDLSQIARTSGGNYQTVRLSFGSSKGISGYRDVDGSAGNSPQDVNGIYQISGTRIGATDSNTITLRFNNNVPTTPNYMSGAFSQANEGTIEVELNDSVIDTLDLTSSTGGITVGVITVGALLNVTFDNGNPVDSLFYRTGSITLTPAQYTNGFNKVIVRHIRNSDTVVTNFLEWVYDSNSDSLSINSATLSNLTLSNTREISGVRYYSTGTVDFDVTVDNIYRNVYTNGNSAFSYPSRTNLSDATSVVKSGTFLSSETNNVRNYAELTTTLNAETTDANFLSTHSINSSVIGFDVPSNPTEGKIETSIQVTHPLKSNLTGGASDITGFLVYQRTQTNDLENEDFIDELNRLQDRDYSTITRANILTGNFDWDSAESLVGTSGQHNTGLLVINGELMYPNSPVLGNKYGINNGNFTLVPNSPTPKVNYSTASGLRTYYRKFQSNNAASQGDIIVEISTTNDVTQFITTPSQLVGNPTGQDLKVEGWVKKLDDNFSTAGYFNFFSSDFANNNGVENVGSETENIAGGVKVGANLRANAPVDSNDIIILRITAPQTWSGVISNIRITNI